MPLRLSFSIKNQITAENTNITTTNIFCFLQNIFISYLSKTRVWLPRLKVIIFHSRTPNIYKVAIHTLNRFSPMVHSSTNWERENAHISQYSTKKKKINRILSILFLLNEGTTMKENQNKKLKRKSQNSHCSLRAVLSIFIFLWLRTSS